MPIDDDDLSILGEGPITDECADCGEEDCCCEFCDECGELTDDCECCEECGSTWDICQCNAGDDDEEAEDD